MKYTQPSTINSTTNHNPEKRKPIVPHLNFPQAIRHSIETSVTLPENEESVFDNDLRLLTQNNDVLLNSSLKENIATRKLQYLNQRTSTQPNRLLRSEGGGGNLISEVSVINEEDNSRITKKS